MSEKLTIQLRLLQGQLLNLNTSFLESESERLILERDLEALKKRYEELEKINTELREKLVFDTPKQE